MEGRKRGEGMHISLYRRYRPQRFSEVLGQDTAVAVLKKEITTGSPGHAYLFSGPRGSGKTTVARLVAKLLNCTDPGEDGEPCGQCDNCRAITGGDSLDVIEIDGASNRGIDEVRELKEHVCLAPFSSRYKIYIIDEVHMLTDHAFNALLKTLEEPPVSVVFIMATTEPHKVPVTIRSRCQHIPFHRIASAVIASLVRDIGEQEGASFDDAVYWEIARQGDGSMRDALSLLEQALSLKEGDFSLQTVRTLFGGGSRRDMELLMDALLEGGAEGLVRIQTLFSSGLTPERLMEGMFVLCRDMWSVAKWGDKVLAVLPLGEDEAAYVRDNAKAWETDSLWKAMEFSASMIGRSRMGLKSDVAGGLLSGFFESLRKPAPSKPAGLDKTSDQDVIPVPGLENPDKAGKHETPQKSVEENPGTKPPGKETTTPWGDSLETMEGSDPQLAAALLCAEVYVEDGTVTIAVPESNRFAYELLKPGKARSCVHSLARDALGDISVTVCCGDRSFAVSDPVTGDDSEGSEVADPEPGGPLFESVSKSGRRQSRREEKPPAARPVNGAVQEVVSLFNADILTVREEAGEEHPVSEEENGDG